MQVIGLFRELEPLATFLPLLSEVESNVPPGERAIVSAYLRRGIPFFDVMGATIDPRNPSIALSGGPSLVSDGEFIWRLDLAHFVEAYGVELPVKFLQKAVSRASFPPESEILKKWPELLSIYEAHVAPRA